MHALEDTGEYEQNFKIFLAHCSTEKNKELGIPPCVLCMGLWFRLWDVCFVVGCNTYLAKRGCITYR